MGEHSGRVRTKDVRVGQTYRCEVPYSLPLGRFRPETMGPSWWTLSWLRGTHFPLTVVDIDPQARTVEGLRVATSTRVTVDLTDDQVQAVGLPPGRGYQVAGMLLDVEGEPVELPEPSPSPSRSAGCAPRTRPPPPATTTPLSAAADCRHTPAGALHRCNARPPGMQQTPRNASPHALCCSLYLGLCQSSRGRWRVLQGGVAPLTATGPTGWAGSLPAFLYWR